MKAEPLFQEHHQLDTEAFAEIKIWRVPKSVRASDHDYKYFFAYVEKRMCVLRYDNEVGKGDHFHDLDKDRPYKFTTPEKLPADF